MKEFFRTWGGIRPAIKAGPSGPVFRPIKWVVLPLALLALATWVTRISNFDFGAQKAIYTAGGDSWEFGTRSLWWFLYEFGTIPAGIICLLALAGFIVGRFRFNFRKWQRFYLFIIFLGVIGPGIISNLLLKEYWGRPRPRQVVDLGGTYNFEPVLTIDLTSSGKSFPCGHATMGYFFLGGFFLLRRYHKSWAWFFLAFGWCLGFFMGVARMCQGGHFFSDVIWAGAVMYFTAMGLYYALGLHKSIFSEEPRTLPLYARIAIPVVSLCLIGGILLATPYRNVRDYELIKESSQTDELAVYLTLKAGNHKVIPGKTFSAKGEAWGHGVPTSKIAVHFVEIPRGDHTVIHYKERMSGRFTEVDQNMTVRLPWERVKYLNLDASDCRVTINLPANIKPGQLIVLKEGNGQVTINHLPETFTWKDNDDKAHYGEERDTVSEEGAPIIDIDEQFEGLLQLSEQ